MVFTALDLSRRSILPLGQPPAPGAPDEASESAWQAAARLPPRVARRALAELDHLEGTEAALRSARATKMGLAFLAGGFAFAIFPFTPGLVLNCSPSHNPGWQCGARAAAFLTACEAAITSVVTGLALWRERRAVSARADALGLAVQRDAVRSGGEAPPVGLFGAFLGADAAGRQRLRDAAESAACAA